MDVIQRKLEVIDKQLAGGKDFHKRIIQTCPLLFVAVGLIVGIVIQNTFDLSVSIWLILLALLTAATVFFFIIQQSSSTNYQSPITNHQYATAYLALACSACLGAIRLTSFHQPKPNDIRNFVTNERKLATIRGTISTEPYINRNQQWQFAKFQFTDPSSSFYLKLNEVKTTGHVRSKLPGETGSSSIRTSNGANWAKVSGTVRVRVAEPVLDAKAGDHIQAYCWLDRFKEATNPGQFDIAKYLARKNVFIAASIQSRDGIKLLESKPVGIFTKFKSRFKNAATQALLGGPFPENQSEGLLQALLLGYRANIDSSTHRAFRKTGLLHFISLSGLHLGTLAWIIWWLCKTAGLLKRARAAICIIAIVIFLLIVPPRAPTLRAAIICFVFCLSFFFRRRSNPLNTLSLAAIILLLIRPTGLFEAGWQLSFASVLGILVFTEKIENFIYDKTDYWFWIDKPEETPFVTRLIKMFGAKVITLFSIGFAAWLGGAGLVLYHFYMINPFTSIWKLAMFPLVGLILALGYLKIILSFLLPSAAAVLGIIVNGLSDLLIWIVERIASWHIASWDISQILIGHVSPALIILYYCFILFVAFTYFRRPLIKKAICTAMVLAMVVFLGAVKWQRTHRDNLVLTTLDVGHGQAILAQLPGKANVLFDTGSLYKSDVGRRIVIPFLNYNGINKIDAIIISHNDIDHINGIPEIAEHCKVASAYANDAFFRQTSQWGPAKFLKTSLSKKGVKIESLEESNLSSNAKIKILWPSKQICQDETLGDNDKSVVSLIEFAGTEILLCSDIEKFAQRELLRLFPNLKPEIAVLPHHGSARTLEADFLKKLDADVLICSCSQRQYQRQQTNEGKDEVKSFYTATNGAITVSINEDGTIVSECVNE